MTPSLYVALTTCWLGLVSAQAQGHGDTFMNPIVPAYTSDPWVIRHDGWYYGIWNNEHNVTMWRSRTLTDWTHAEKKDAFIPPPGQPYSTDVWAPELHTFDNKWYLIFTADPANDSPPADVEMLCTWNCPAVYHRMYVMEGSTSDPWTSEYSMKGESNGVQGQLDTFDQFAIDGTYFQHSTGLYHVYSCWYTAYQSWPANLCITKMSNPWTVISNVTQRQTISVPSNPWEKTPYGRADSDRLSSNEGPEQLTNPKTGQQFIIYSAARADTRWYCLGMLELVGKDPMNSQDWRKHNDNCVFYSNALEHIYGTGHASFTTSPDGTQDWIVYHAYENPYNGWSARSVRTQQFTWNADGTPNFPRPQIGPLAVPSGQNNSMMMY